MGKVPSAGGPYTARLVAPNIKAATFIETKCRTMWAANRSCAKPGNGHTHTSVSVVETPKSATRRLGRRS